MRFLDSKSLRVSFKHTFVQNLFCLRKSSKFFNSYPQKSISYRCSFSCSGSNYQKIYPTPAPPSPSFHSAQRFLDFWDILFCTLLLGTPPLQKQFLNFFFLLQFFRFSTRMLIYLLNCIYNFHCQQNVIEASLPIQNSWQTVSTKLTEVE